MKHIQMIEETRVKLDLLENRVDLIEEEMLIYLNQSFNVFLTRKEVANLVRLSKKTIADSKEFKKIECRIKSNGKVLYPRDEVLELIKNKDNYE